MRAIRFRFPRLALLGWLTIFLAAPLPSAAQSTVDYRDALWIGHTNGLSKVDLSNGHLLFKKSGIGDVRAVAVDGSHGLVWAFAAGQLRSYDLDGNLRLNLAINSRPPLLTSVPTNPLPETLVDADDLEDAYCKVNGIIPSTISPNALWPLAKLAASPEDGSVWMGMGDHLMQIASDGAVLVDTTTPGLITGLSVDPNSYRVWVSTCGATYSYELNGNYSRKITLGGLTAWQKDVAFDPVYQYFWVGLRGLASIIGLGEMRRYSESGVSQQIMGSGFSVQHLASDHHGLVWSSSDSILTYSKGLNGQRVTVRTVAPFANDGGLLGGALNAIKPCIGLDVISANLPSSKDCTIVALVAHPESPYAVAAIPALYAQVGTNGQIVRRVALTGIGEGASAKIRSLGLYTDSSPPDVSIVMPLVNGVLSARDNRCFFEGDGGFCVDIEYFDSGSGVDPGTLTLTINGAPFDVSQCTIGDASASCYVSPYRDGPVSLAVTVADHGGHVRTFQYAFILDCFFPELILDPYPAFTNNPQLSFSGSISEIGSMTFEGEDVELDAARRFLVGPLTLEEGENSFTFRVTDSAGNRGRSTVVVELDTAPPDVDVTTPANGFLTNQDTVVVTGSTNEESTVDVNATPAFLSGTQFTSHPVHLAEGNNLIQVTATDRAGNASVRLISGTLDTTPPEAPAAGKISRTGSGGQVTVAGTAGSVEGGSIVKIADTTSGAQIEVTANADGSFSATLSGLKSDAFQVRARDAAGNEGNSTGLVGGPFSGPIVFGVITPGNNQTVNGDTVLVSVGLQAPPNTGVTINDIPAVAAPDGAGLKYYAEIPLEIGSNIVKIVAHAQDGRTASRTITVGSLGPFAYRIILDRASGMSPLTTRLTVEDRFGGGIQHIQVDFEDDGVFDMATAPGGVPINATYTGVGVQQSRVIVFNDNGAGYAFLVKVVLLDPETVNQNIQAVWAGMNAALVAGEKDAAMSFLTFGAKEQYDLAFELLMARMPQIISEYSLLKPSLISSEYSEYGVNRTVDGVKRAFLIGFVTNEFGQWQLDSM